jgi:uncharacterized membrane protein
MELLTGLLSAFGLSASTGLNAYIPLLIVGLLDKYTELISLNQPWDALSHPATLVSLTVLVLIETFADNAPLINHINDAIQTFVRPTAGAIVFAASTDAASDLHPALALVAGLLVSGSVHAAKSTVVRPAVTAATGGLGNTPVAMAEDAIAVSVSIAAVAAPLLGILLLIMFFAPVFLIIRWTRTRLPKNALDKEQP